MRIILYICTFILAYPLTTMAQNTDALRSSIITASPWAVDQCYIDSMLYPKAINAISHFYQDGTFSRADRDTLVAGPVWNFTATNQLAITYSESRFNELYDIVVLEPNILILRNEVMDTQQQKKHTIEIRYKPYVND